MNIEAIEMAKQTANGTFGNLNKAHGKHMFVAAPANQVVRFIRLEAGTTIYGVGLDVKQATANNEFQIGVESTHPDEVDVVLGSVTADSSGNAALSVSHGLVKSFKYPAYITVKNVTSAGKGEVLATLDYVYNGVG